MSESALFVWGFSYRLLQNLTPYAETSSPVPSVGSTVPRAVISIPEQRSQNARLVAQLGCSCQGVLLHTAPETNTGMQGSLMSRMLGEDEQTFLYSPVSLVALEPSVLRWARNHLPS